MWNVIAVATNYLTLGAYLYFRRREAPFPATSARKDT
jgi:hypothetical protein